MPVPQPPLVPLNLWRALLEQLITFRRAEPWAAVPDSALAVYVDPAGQPWFACILGHGGQLFGLSLYRGMSGLRFYRAVQRLGAEFDLVAHRHEVDAVSVWFGSLSELDAHQRAIYRQLGYAPRRGERLAWPDVRSHRPGFFPWHVDETEVRVLTAAIPGLLRFAALYRRDPDAYHVRAPDDLPMLPAGDGPQTIDALEWRTWRLPGSEPPAPAIAADTSSPGFFRVASLPQADETFEVDTFYLPEPVGDGGRPYYPRCIAVLRAAGGYCFGMALLRPGDDAAARAAAMLFEAAEQLGARPTRIAATQEELVQRLEHVARSVGAAAVRVRRLPAAEEFRRGLEAHARGPH